MSIRKKPLIYINRYKVACSGGIAIPQYVAWQCDRYNVVTATMTVAADVNPQKAVDLHQPLQSSV